jgi:hypothetical protein
MEKMGNNDDDINTITQSVISQSALLERSIIVMANDHKAEIAELKKNNCDLREKVWRRTELAIMSMFGFAIAAVPLIFSMFNGC